MFILGINMVLSSLAYITKFRDGEKPLFMYFLSVFLNTCICFIAKFILELVMG